MRRFNAPPTVRVLRACMRWAWTVALIAGLSTALYAQSPSRLVVGYYPSWMKYSVPSTVIPYQYLTHIAHAFIFPKADGTLDLSGFTLYPELIQAAHQNDVRVVISIGGWDDVRTPRFAQMAADTAARHRFVAAVKDFCVQYEYDGADIDWEYPASTGQTYTTALFQELRAAFNASPVPLSLSIAAPATDPSNRYNWTVMKELLDWVGVMTYDFYGGWTPKAGPNSPLYGNYTATDQGWIDNSVNHYLSSKGVPASKLLIGIPFYGWKFTAPALYGASTAASQMAYSAIAPLMQSGWVRNWDNISQTPWIVNSTATNVISYDDSVSIAEKCAYVRTKNLGGAIIWAVGQDMQGSRFPLLESVGNGMTGVAAVTASVSAIPENAELDQNYPNPFNSQSVIRFRLAAPSRVTLRLFDLLGRELATLLDGERPAGEQQVRVSSRGLASGVYLYRLQTGNAVLSRTMIVMQ